MRVLDHLIESPQKSRRAQESCDSSSLDSPVRRVDDGIHRQRRNVALADLDHG